MTAITIESEFSRIDRLGTLPEMEVEIDKLPLDEACLVVGFGMASDRLKRVNGSGWWTLLARVQERARCGT